MIILICQTGSFCGSHDRLGHPITGPNHGSPPEPINLCCFLAKVTQSIVTLLFSTYLNTWKYNSFEAYEKKNSFKFEMFHSK